MRGMTTRPAIDEILMIMPEPCARMIGTTARIAAAAARTLSLNSVSTSALDALPMVALIPWPALFTRMSIPPSSRITSSAICVTAPSAVTSVGITTAEPPSDLISAATSSSAGRLRDASVLQPHALMLAASTEIGRLAAGRQLRDPMSAARALSLGLAVDGHETPILLARLVPRLAFDRFDGRAEHLVGRRIEPRQLIGLEGRSLAQWQEFGFMENLVGVRVANSGDERLVAEQILQLAGMATDALGKFGEGHRESVRAELRPSRDRRQCPRHHPVDAAHFHGVQKTQLVATFERDPKDGRGRNFL